MIKSNLQQSSGIAISGPNALEISFPKSYHFNLEYCQRRDHMSRLEAELEEIVGRKIGITLKLVDDPPQITGAKDQNAAQSGAKQRIDPENDPLVKKAMSVFNATVVKVEER